MSESSTFIPGWVQKPFPGITLSAGGLLALADLHTIAERTAITGGASWMDILLLAPGLHYQQAADQLFRKGGEAIVAMVDKGSGSAERPIEFELDRNDDAAAATGGNGAAPKKTSTLNRSQSLKINNAATAQYIQSIAKPGEVVTLDVGRLVASKGRYKLKRSNSGYHASAWLETNSSGIGWVSHILYLLGPLLTFGTIALAVLFKDWWCLVFILALMLSRLLNVWVIKQRASHLDTPEEKPATKSRPRSPSRSRIGFSSSSSTSLGAASDPGAASRHRSRSRISIKCEEIVSYIISLGDDNKTKVKLRGKPSDLRQITSRVWLRSKTHLEGYIEAAAKLIVYIVASLSGNMTQVGNLIMMVLLLTTAGLLALSNHRAKAFKVGGVLGVVEDADKAEQKKAEEQKEKTKAAGSEQGSMDERGRGHHNRDNTAVRLATESGRAADAGERMRRNPADLAERGQAGSQQHIKWNELRRPPGQPAPRPPRGPKQDPRR
ncbi:hypothetical protein QBC43DRAFT_322785 [Cladorrhinum sp. PSN259]|nr:hypothetical protein QBC43DRAFT_322785 [Cladorrhinum sp. PSN259]